MISTLVSLSTCNVEGGDIIFHFSYCYCMQYRLYCFAFHLMHPVSEYLKGVALQSWYGSLKDNVPGVQPLIHIVDSAPTCVYSCIKRILIALCALKCRQKAWMYVDNSVGVLVNKVFGDKPHIVGKDAELHVLHL